MKADLHGCVQKVAAFLGYTLDGETVDKISKQCTFSAMKDNKAVNQAHYANDFPHFFRKGEVGDWRNHFTQEQSARMDTLVSEKLAGTGLEYNYGQ